MIEENKFSVLTYTEQIKKGKNEMPQQVAETENHSSQYLGFYRLVDEMRAFLAAAGSHSEEERMRYNNILNRAVLGFSEEKQWLLAMINDQLLKKRIHDIPPPNQKYKNLAEAIFSEVIGLNVLELILKNKEGLEEIQVIGKKIFEVRKGQANLSRFQFQTIKEVERIQQNLLLYNNETLSPKKKWSEAMLSDGSRVTMTGFGFTGEPTLTIRFYTMENFDLRLLCHPEYETINEAMKELILGIIHSYFNLIIIGSTNSGKTSFIKALIAEMPDHERIVTIESRRELHLKRDFPNKNIIEYEIDEEDIYHTSKQAFKLALRQSPKRIIHAEIRDEDANIFVRACTRGHEGSITTLHANELEDVPEAITDMCMLDQRGMNPDRLAKRIANFVTQIGIEMALVHGKRKIVRICEFRVIKDEVVVHDIVGYDHILDQWNLCGKLTPYSAKRIYKHDRSKFDTLLNLGLVESCTV